MKGFINALAVEIRKNRHSKITWVTFIAFSLGPLFGAVFMLIMKDDSLTGALKAKAVMMSVSADWNSLLGIMSQVVGVGGVLIFGFVAAWLFGREYSDGTVKDLLALPVSRASILNAKFAYYLLWCLALVISNLLLALIIGFILQLPGWSADTFLFSLQIYFITTLLILLLNTPVAFLAIAGKGYLVPLGLVALTLVFAQVIGALGYGTYFPWAIPGIYSGSGGEALKSQLNTVSYTILFLVSAVGYAATILWWKHSDQT